ncbi:MAG: hypothetical protein KKD28_12780 [Chloroflexi bacterium]|nr:hypothetical protein [Chloroflexota bacterium]
MLTIPLLTSLVLSLLLIPIIRSLGFRFGLVADPRADRWHSKPTPKYGGIGIFLAFGIAVLVSMGLAPMEQQHWPLLAGAGLIFIIGVFDDFKRISPPAKLVGEIIAAAIVVFFGRNIDFFSLDILNIIFTFGWLVGITNAINLLDNMDGLAGGIAFIAAGLLSFLFWQSGTQSLLLISLALAGGVLGFLVFNFPPASIFMGDGGSLFLGFTLAALAIARVPKASDLLAVMGVPTLLFLLPILDTTLVTITRILRGQSPAHGGKDHTSHRLIAFGLSERQVVLSLYGVALLAGIIGTTLESIDYTISLILIPILLVSMALLTAYLGRLKVVGPDAPSPPQGAITRLMVGLTYRGRILEIGLDLVLISIACYLAFWIHLGSNVDIINLDIFLNSLPIALAGTYTSFFVFGIYRGVWQYISLRDLLRYAGAVLGAVVLIAVSVLLVYPSSEYYLRTLLSFAVFLFLGLGVSRSSFKIMDQVYNQQTRPKKQESSSILIYGADDAGVMILQWLLQDTRHGFDPVGFIDDDLFKRGRQILGISVLGSVDDLETVITRSKVEGVILSSDEALANDQIRKAIAICGSKDIWIKRLRIEFDDVGHDAVPEM